jgi:hypothetical protein
MSQLKNREKEEIKKKSAKPNNVSIILSKFNTVYRHSVLDILTHYSGIPTDPNPDNNPLSIRDPNDSRNNNPNISTTLLNSKTESKSITNVKIKNIELDQIIISFKYPLIDMEMIKPIPFNETFKSWDQVENKLIEMSKIAANSRDLSHLRVSGITYPSSFFNLILLFLVFILILGYFNPEFLYNFLFNNYLPSLLLLKNYHNSIFFATITIHLFEVYYFLFPRIKKFRVPFDYTIEWFVLTMLDGFESIKRFDSYVETLSNDDTYYDFTNIEYFL